MEADLCGVDLVAGGSDWARVHAHVCDARGTVCPFADDGVRFPVEGRGVVIGGREVGATSVRAKAGVATALIRSTSRAGQIIVTASAFGLAAGEVAINSVAPAGAHPPEKARRSRTAAAPVPVAHR